ncbi:hypothetical protein, partial [Micromonospora sp. DH14]|uniref:hypothetical protein n=1 Tax=Micromonospora sp. DH14 TaxID=3040120 RepID=UPI00244239F5
KSFIDAMPMTGIQAALGKSFIDAMPMTGIQAALGKSFIDAMPLANLLNGLLDTAPASLEVQPTLWTPEGERRRLQLRRLTPEQRVWLLVILLHLVVASVQHVSSLVSADNPHFDLEKFVAHHVQALGASLGYYSLKKTMKK